MRRGGMTSITAQLRRSVGSIAVLLVVPAVIGLVVMMLFFMAYYFLRAYTGTDILEIYPYIPFWKN